VSLIFTCIHHASFILSCLQHTSSIFCLYQPYCCVDQPRELYFYNRICCFSWLLNFCFTGAIFFLDRSSDTIVMLTYFVHRSRELIQLNRAPNFRAYHAMMHYFCIRARNFYVHQSRYIVIIFDASSCSSIELRFLSVSIKLYLSFF